MSNAEPPEVSDVELLVLSEAEPWSVREDSPSIGVNSCESGSTLGGTSVYLARVQVVSLTRQESSATEADGSEGRVQYFRPKSLTQSTAIVMF